MFFSIMGFFHLKNFYTGTGRSGIGLRFFAPYKHRFDKGVP